MTREEAIKWIADNGKEPFTGNPHQYDSNVFFGKWFWFAYPGDTPESIRDVDLIRNLKMPAGGWATREEAIEALIQARMKTK